MSGINAKLMLNVGTHGKPVWEEVALAPPPPPTDGDLLLAAIHANPVDDTPRLVYADWLDEQAGDVPCPSCVAILQPTRGGCWPCARCGAKDWDSRGTVPDGRAERAEFIRVQCELAHFPESEAEFAKLDGGMRRRFHDLAQRELELEQLNESRGWGGIFLFGGDGALWSIMERMEEDPVWRRGFIAELHAGTDGCDMPRVLQLCESPHVVLEQLTCTAADWIAHADAILAAHPVMAVRLTTWPGETPGWAFPPDFEILPDGRHRYPRWKGVTFTLPEGTA